MGFQNKDKFLKRLNSLTSPAAMRKIGKALHESADFIAVEAQISITTGAVSGKNHTPSAPGEPPNNDTGTLAGRIEALSTGPLSAKVVATAAHSVPLEFGSSKMEARPFLRPARDKNVKKVRAHVAKALNEIVRGM